MMTEAALSAEVLLAARGVCKAFGGVRVLKEVDFELRRGEVHALVGENGAGKSTLMNIFAGVLPPDAGAIVFAGQRMRGYASAHAAQQRGIAMVFQERSLFRPLSVAENIFAGRQPVSPSSKPGFGTRFPGSGWSLKSARAKPPAPLSGRAALPLRKPVTRPRADR